ncbi:hypothetical protein BX070DRAFT_251411 [Coemansia spiralis]|uniref:Uncharacterized protein n=1 Tax=Coemansia umbellata TaxID=1424467 RepID=A0ABQ8PU78_9FUNG|nr:hypothetical protein BX070DRAFT_251411 [Coemansia spiralis]KAJ1995781.1 hypothetical protein EDC05_000715 [Coemansia umbellata]
MRRARAHMSWSDSMASSMTITDSRSVAVRQHGGSRLARPGYLARQIHTEALQHLAQEISASRINEEPEDLQNIVDIVGTASERSEAADALQTYRELSFAWGSMDGDSDISSNAETRSRMSKAARVIRRKTRRFFYLVSYYISKFLHDYGASVAVYRPAFQFGLYY